MRLRIAGVAVCLAGFAMLSSCAKPAPTAKAAPPEVQVVQVVQKDVPVYGQWIGTLTGIVNAEIKPQVSGYLLRERYTEGSFVKKGQLLFEIDPRPFQVALDQAKAAASQATGQLAQANSQLIEARAGVLNAEANQGKTELDVKRYAPLARERAVTQQEMDNAVQADLAAKAQVSAARARVTTSQAAIEAAKAAVEAAQAAVATAQLNLGFTRVLSPIDGIAGISRAQIGDLIGPTSEPLTTVSTVNPIRVFFTVSEQEYLDHMRTYPTETQRQARRQNIRLNLILADGSLYPHQGRFYVADREVNQQTGTIRLAGLFPNPGNILRPGQFGRVRAVREIRRDALVVPQRAVNEMQGIDQVAVVTKGNKVNIRAVKVGIRSDNLWVIDEGLRAGETVIVEGLQRIQQGMVVNPKPFREAKK